MDNIKQKERLSVIIISKDAENERADALSSVDFADEVIVVDSGSEDRTVDVAKRMGALVFEYNAKDFSDGRNFGLKQAKGEWILYIDTDERVSSELAINIKHKITSPINQNIVAYRVSRKNFYFGNHQWPYIEHLERLFRRDKLEGWYGRLHESPRVKGNIGVLEGYLLHYTHRNLTSMVSKTIEWSKIEAELRFKSGHPKMNWWRFPRVMLTVFFDSYIRQGGWRVGTAGLVESMYQSFSIFITYARLWEMQQEINKNKTNPKPKANEF